MSLEWVWRFSKLSPNSYVFIFLLFTFFGQEEWVWSEFGDSPNWLQIRSKLICFLYFTFFLKRGMSLEWVWRFSKLSPNSIQTQMISCFIVLSLYCFFIFVRKRQTTLEWVWRFSKLSPNSLQTHMFSDFSVFFVLFYLLFILLFWEKGHEFGVCLGILQAHPKLTWFLFFLCFPFIVILNIFFGEERNEFGVSLEVLQTSNSLQTYSKLAPNSYGFILLFLLYC